MEELEEIFKCEQCPKQYSTKASLMHHSRSKHERPRIKCEQCEKTFLYKTHLREHVNYAHAIQKEVSCKRCFKVFASNAHLSTHMIAKHGKGEMKCVHCHRFFKFQQTLMVHMEKFRYGQCKAKPKTTNTLEEYRCEQCQALFDIEDDFLEHIFTPHENHTLTCEQCGKQCRNQAILTKHVQNVHQIALLRCEVCRKQMRSLQQLRSHVKQHEKNFSCNQCGKSYSQISTLKTHVKEVHEGLTYKCSKCHLKFQRRQALTRHLASNHLIANE